MGKISRKRPKGQVMAKLELQTRGEERPECGTGGCVNKARPGPKSDSVYTRKPGSAPPGRKRVAFGKRSAGPFLHHTPEGDCWSWVRP
jgi:hypothetical protein